MSKVSTKPATLSAKEMYALYAKLLLAMKDPVTGTEKYVGTRSSKYSWEVANNLITDKQTGQMIMNYKLFKQILSTYNKLAGEKLIKGYTLDLLNGVGNIFIARVQRNPNSPRLNHHESKKLYKKLKEEGRLTKENWKVFYTGDDFISMLWHKENKSLRNINLYKFVLAGGQPGKGYRTQMSRAIMSNPALKALYPYIPYQQPMTKEAAHAKFKKLKENDIHNSIQ